jgi:hypothetical protein
MPLFKFDDIQSTPDENSPSNSKPVIEHSCSNQSGFSGTGAMVIRELISHFKANQTYHYASAGAWNSHELLEQLLKFTGPSRVYFTTWAMSENPVRSILNLIDQGLITELNCVFDLKVQDRAPKVFQLIQGITTRVRLVHCHAKVFVIENDLWGISNSGSANWTRNPRMEAGVLSTDPKIARFHRDWIMRLIEQEHGSDTGPTGGS